MVVYTQFKDGYKMETTWGTSLIEDADDIAYIWGIYSKNCSHPSPVTSVIYGETGVNEVESPDGSLTKGVFVLNGQYGIIPFNGILLWMVMGLSSTVGADPYTHTITVPAAVGGVLPELPSFTVQHERTGTADDWSTQYMGCKINEMQIISNYKTRGLVFLLDVMAKSTEKVAFTLNNEPTFATGTSEFPYLYINMTRTYDGADLDGMVGMQLTINNDIMAEYANTFDTVTHNFTGMWPQFFTEGDRKIYSLDIEYQPEASDIWEELLVSTITKPIVFKWTKSANDYIQITCTDCGVIGHTMVSPKTSEEPRLDRITIEFRSISIEVKDSIAGGFYGE